MTATAQEEGGRGLHEAKFRSEPEYSDQDEALTSLKVLSGARAREAVLALGSETRWEIFSLVKDQPAHIEQLARSVGKDKSTVSRHVDALAKAGLVKTVKVEGSRGTRKRVCPSSNRLYLDLS
jgi:predicted transcriptional regulator